GSGLGAVVALSPASLTFPSVEVGTSSTAQTVNLSNTGNFTLNISNIQATGDYTLTNNCPASLSANSTCTVKVTFSPTGSGQRSGTIVISDNASGNPHIVSLTGVGSDFSLASSPSTATVKAGATATYALTVSPMGGAFTNAINLACTGAPVKASCSLST